MNLRQFNQRFLEPGSQLFMIGGIIFLCQPWVPFLHEWSVLVMLQFYKTRIERAA